MANEEKAPQEKQLAKFEEQSLDETQLAEQLYNSAGLNPVVEAGIKDYDKRLQQEDKVITKVFGPRGSDIKGYGEAVAKRTALAVYGLLNKQYGGQMGDLRSYIMALEDERDRANARYDDLMGRVVGTLGEEYKDLRSDSNEFMEKLTTVLGQDAKQAKIDQAALAERLADIDGLRSEVKALTEEKKRLEEDHQSQVTTLTEEQKRLEKEHQSQVAALNSRIESLESEKTALSTELARLNEAHNGLTKAATTLTTTIPQDEIGESLGEELHTYVLNDSKIPHAVLDGVGKFIDLKKYLRVAAKRGAEEATRQSEQTLRNLTQQS